MVDLFFVNLSMNIPEYQLATQTVLLVPEGKELQFPQVIFRLAKREFEAKYEGSKEKPKLQLQMAQFLQPQFQIECSERLFNQIIRFLMFVDKFSTATKRFTAFRDEIFRPLTIEDLRCVIVLGGRFNLVALMQAAGVYLSEFVMNQSVEDLRGMFDVQDGFADEQAM